MTFGERLRTAREHRGFNSKEVAEAIGVAPSTYSQYETGSREPDVLKIQKISDFLQVSGDYLLLGIKADSVSIDISLSNHEKKLIRAYRAHPDMQPAVNALLGVTFEQNDCAESLPIAARSGIAAVVNTSSSKEERNAALDEELPGVSTPGTLKKF